MQELLKASLFVALALLVPIIPFLVLGGDFEQNVEQWVQTEMSIAARFTAIAGVLAIDIFLPIPSSAVSTIGGGVLGGVLGTLASWLGMMVGSILGFGLARRYGKTLVVRLAGDADIERLSRLAEKFGPLILVLTRALPILAEACVLLLGTTQLSWKRFLVPVSICNLVIAAVYSAAGQFAREHNLLMPVVIGTVSIPFVIVILVRRWLPTEISEDALEKISPNR